jgi:hypothetical protein
MKTLKQTIEDDQEIKDSPCAFTRAELKALNKGLTTMFEELGISVTTRMVSTSKKSISLYIKFNDREMRTIRISTHKPVFSQIKYLNIY